MAEKGAMELYADAVVNGLMSVMDDAGGRIADGMRERLKKGGHIDTGALYESIRSETVREDDKIATYIYADAKSEQGAYYAEFIEHGTGAAHGRIGGREGTWRYRDRNGQWHTTDGMDADPFIEPSVEEVLPAINDLISGVMYDIDKYGR